MDIKIKNYLGFAAVFALILVTFSVLWYTYSYSRSIDPASLRSFAVTGEGSTVAVPDIAELSVGVTTQGGTNLATLQDENSKDMNRITIPVKPSTS